MSWRVCAMDSEGKLTFLGAIAAERPVINAPRMTCRPIAVLSVQPFSIADVVVLEPVQF